MSWTKPQTVFSPFHQNHSKSTRLTFFSPLSTFFLFVCLFVARAILITFLDTRTSWRSGKLGSWVRPPLKRPVLFFFPPSLAVSTIVSSFFLCFSHGRCLLRTALPANMLADFAMIAPTSKCSLNPYTGVFCVRRHMGCYTLSTASQSAFLPLLPCCCGER